MSDKKLPMLWQLQEASQKLMDEMDDLFDKIFEASPLEKEKARYNEIVEQVNFLMEDISEEIQYLKDLQEGEY